MGLYGFGCGFVGACKSKPAIMMEIHVQISELGNKNLWRFYLLEQKKSVDPVN